MSESIKGSKSFLYSGDPVPNIENSGDNMQHQSVQEIAGKRGAADVMIHGTTVVSTGHIIEAGSTRKLIVSASSNAKQGWFMRMTSGNSIGEEISIIKVIDANSFIISALFDIALTDTFEIARSVSPNYTASGNLNVVTVQTPIQFVLDGVDTEVELDTVVPANTKPLPTEMIFNVDGTPTRVSYDTVTPTNSNAIPVNIVTVNGTGISTTVDLTGAQINVQLSDRGTSPDATRIGDGTNLMGINANLEALVHDADMLAKAEQIRVIDVSIDTKTPALGQALAAASVPVVLTAAQLATLTPPGAISGFALEATQLDVETAVQSIDSKTPALGQALSAASSPVVLPAAQIATLTPPAAITGFALEATQLDVETAVQSIDTKTPALGQALAAASVPVVLTASQLTILTPPAAITGFALEATQSVGNVLIGAVTETAPATDTGISGLNGRLQRVAQRITSLIALLPTSLGQKTMANSFAVTFASDQTGIQTTDAVQVGTYDQSLVVANSGVTTLTAPANAKSCKVMAGDANISNLRVTLDGSVPTNTRGIQFQAGRSEDFTGVVSLQVIAQDVATNQEIYVHWSA